MTGLSDKKWF